jgi:hypothetical protein
MKTLITILALGSLIATSAFAKTAQVPTNHVDPHEIYQSYSLGQQSFPNPDRNFNGPNVYHGGE